MLTKYTAADISSRIVGLGKLLDVLHGECELLPATQEAIKRMRRTRSGTTTNF